MAPEKVSTMAWHLRHMKALSRIAMKSRRASQKKCKDRFDLLGLPTEIIVQILQEFPPLPAPGIAYHVDNLDDVHPCFALCSISSFLKDCYTVYIGKLPTSIEVTIRPADYLVDGGVAKMHAKLNRRFSTLGEGMSNVNRLNIIGPSLDLTTEDDRLNKIVEHARTHYGPRRLWPAHKILLKEQIEREIPRKHAIIEKLFSCLSVLADDMMIGELAICPEHLPALAWADTIRDFVLEHSCIYAFDLIHHPEHHSYRGRVRWSQRWPSIPILNGHWFDADYERPYNYPKNQAVHEHRWRKVQEAIDTYLSAKNKLDSLSLEDDKKDDGTK